MDSRGTITFAFPFTSLLSSASSEQSTQSSLTTLLPSNAERLSIGISIEVAVDMPTEILAFSSPTHELCAKSSATKASVKLAHPMFVPTDFVL